jgi:MYXO-CTERM domain-containing protein
MRSLALLLAPAALLFAAPALAANHYVRAGATGASTGADWSTAWKDFASIDFAAVSCGDTVWLAGGTYAGTLTVTKTCAPTSPLTIARVTSGDAAPTAAPGWSPSFDSTVDITGSPGIDVPGGSGITIDGRIDYGIRITLPKGGGNGVFAADTASVDSLSLRHVEVVGPACTLAKPCTVAAYGINLAPENNQITNLLVSHCRVHGISEALRASNWTHVVIEHTAISDTENDGVDHEDVIYSYPSTDVVWRYNTIWNSPNDGIFFEFGGAVSFYFYGNVYYASTASLLTTKAPGTYGPIYIFNNTFHAPSAADYGFITFNTSTIAAGTQVFNNVFYNVTNDTDGADSDYNAYNYTMLNGYPWPSSEPHSFTFVDQGDQFVDVATGDFHLVPGSALINKGKGLMTDGFVDHDMDGNTRGADGTWDVGAFERCDAGCAPAADAGGGGGGGDGGGGSSPAADAGPDAGPGEPDGGGGGGGTGGAAPVHTSSGGCGCQTGSDGDTWVGGLSLAALALVRYRRRAASRAGTAAAGCRRAP